MVYAVDPRIDPASRRVPLRARIENPGGRLKPGMFAEVALVLAVRDNALWVPEQAIVPTTSVPYVYRVVDGKAVMTQVETGSRRPGFVEIVDGLQAGDVVVTEGQTRLFDGAQVMVTPPPAVGPAKT
jgi:membrane fusion protein (multidrug efflux system)